MDWSIRRPLTTRKLGTHDLQLLVSVQNHVGAQINSGLSLSMAAVVASIWEGLVVVVASGGIDVNLLRLCQEQCTREQHRLVILVTLHCIPLLGFSRDRLA